MGMSLCDGQAVNDYPTIAVTANADWPVFQMMDAEYPVAKKKRQFCHRL